MKPARRRGLQPERKEAKLALSYLTADEKGAVVDLYFSTANEAFNAAASAEQLGLGWSLTGFDCPTGPAADVFARSKREYGLRTWRQLWSDHLPWVKAPS